MFSIAALVLRPLINPFLHPGNARLWMVLGTAGLMLSLWGYALALSLWSMILIRILHGMSYVVMGTAFATTLVRFIPKSRSGQAFGLIAVIMLLPFAIIPPALNYLIKDFGGFIGF
jgi:MFS family permease